MNAHDAEFIRMFVIADRRDRYLSLIDSEKGRRKLTDKLNHHHEIDPRFLHKIPPHEQSVDSIFRMLKGRRAPSDCYLFGGGDLDGQEMDLKDALTETVGYGAGTFISCIPGKLGYFEAKEPGERYLVW